MIHMSIEIDTSARPLLFTWPPATADYLQNIADKKKGREITLPAFLCDPLGL
jgi:hypothetical protein